MTGNEKWTHKGFIQNSKNYQYAWKSSPIDETYVIRRGKTQDPPLALIPWYIVKNSYFVGIKPLLKWELIKQF